MLTEATSWPVFVMKRLCSISQSNADFLLSLEQRDVQTGCGDELLSAEPACAVAPDAAGVAEDFAAAAGFACFCWGC